MLSLSKVSFGHSVITSFHNVKGGGILERVVGTHGAKCKVSDLHMNIMLEREKRTKRAIFVIHIGSFHIVNRTIYL